MKPIKKREPAPPPASELLEEQRSKIIELGIEVEQLRHELENKVKSVMLAAADEHKAFISKIAREHFDMREDRMLRRIFDHFSQTLFWENKTVYTGASMGRNDMEELNRQGWHYVTTVYDGNASDVTKRHAVMFRRPKLPGSFAEFREMYDSFVNAERLAKIEAKKKAEAKKAAAEQVDADVAKAVKKQKKLVKKKVE